MREAGQRDLQLEDGSRIGVIGGGPAGSFFAYFLLQFAECLGIKVELDIHEPRDFAVPGPTGCNMCGGIISESLVQNLAAEGIILPSNVVQRGIDSYYLHMDVGDVRIETPLKDKRIAAVHRGGGPRGSRFVTDGGGLDGHLLEMAVNQGARRVRARVDGLCWDDAKPQIKTQDGQRHAYDLLAVAVGVNSPLLKLFENLNVGYKPPQTTKTYICEFCFGRDLIRANLGNAMHVFLLNIPRLEFAALIPKGEYVTLCLLGKDIDRELVRAFLGSNEVRQVLPPNWEPPADFCHCAPKISVASAVQPFADRLVFVGDSGTTRLYKDGIGAAYRTSKAAAKAAVFHGISEEDFRQHYWPVCKRIRSDNLLGTAIFAVTHLVQRSAITRRGLWRMTSHEQCLQGVSRRMSRVLWDTFTGSAPYKSVLLSAFHPAFWARFIWNIAKANSWSAANQKARSS
jgi:flavin-dependent dehydrogenase